MGYYLNLVLINNENNFERIEEIYHSIAYADYESLKRKSSGKLYNSVSIKYFPVPEKSSICISDEGNIIKESIAEELSCKLKEIIISIKIFDSDELVIQAFKNGKKIAGINKNHQDYKIQGDISFIYPDKEKCLSILKEDYRFMEDCAEKLFPKQMIYPEEKIENQKVVKYHKELIIPLETEKLPVFENHGCVPPDPDSKQFRYRIINRGKKSKGITVYLRGSAIINKNIKVNKAYANAGFIGTKQAEIVKCSEPKIDEKNGNCLMYRFDDFEFPAGYNKEALDGLFSSGNMSLYNKGLDYMYQSCITISFDCEISKLSGIIEVLTVPDENIKKGAIYTEIEVRNYPLP